jgi:hypothetical protein
MNNIENFRETLRNNVNKTSFEKGKTESFFSPTKKFRADVSIVGPYTVQVEIYKQRLNKKLFDFLVNEDCLRHEWVKKNKTEYLICAEDIYGGQTVLDLTHAKMSSYVPNEEGFIWTEFYLSPNGVILATCGCHWACPFVIKFFDFSEPLNLPLKELKEIDLLDNDNYLTVVGWLDNNTLKVKKKDGKEQLLIISL